MRKIAFVLLTLTLASSNAFATYICSGKVQGVAITPQSGLVHAERLGPLVWPAICSVDTETSGISVESCKVIYSTLLTAQMASKTVTLWFNDDKDCSVDSHAPWTRLTGWYFGPKISD